MSVIDQWHTILSAGEGEVGYNLAIRYYEERRNNFIKILAAQYKQKIHQAQKDIELNISNILLDMGSEETSTGTKESAQALLSDVSAYVRAYIRTNTGFRESIGKILGIELTKKGSGFSRKSIGNTIDIEWTIAKSQNELGSPPPQQNNSSESRKALNEYNKRLFKARTEFTNKLMKIIGNRKELIELIDKLNKEIFVNNAQNWGDNSKTIITMLKGYALRVVLATYVTEKTGDQKITQMTNTYKSIIGGYLKEEATANVLNTANLKLLNNFLGTQFSALAESYGAKYTPEDFIFLVGNSKTNPQELVTFQSAADAVDPQNNIDYYAGQIKSWRLDEVRGDNIRDWFPIGTRTNLFNQFQDWYKTQFGAPNTYHMAGNMAFFITRQQAIQEALGVQNIMFITGNKRMWMSEFIREFRKRKLYLQFDMRKKRGQEKEPTPHISLYLYKAQVYSSIMDKLTK